MLPVGRGRSQNFDLWSGTSGRQRGINNQNTMYKAVIFDLDGVIVNTDDCHYRAWKQMAEEEGIYFDREINERLRGVSRMESLSIILENSDKIYSDPEKQALALRKNQYYVELIRLLTPRDILPGVMDVLMALKQQGTKVAIGSSSKNALMILKRLKLDTVFDAVADGNDITRSKPDPEVFLVAAQKMATEPGSCLVVEDAKAGIEAAKAGGMIALGIGPAASCPQADFKAKSLSDPSAWAILVKLMLN
jgi:beta-phosphoglucomutase